jgi:hypothetical protein
VFGVASMATTNQHETIDTPCLILYKIGEQKFCVISVDLFFSKALAGGVKPADEIHQSSVKGIVFWFDPVILSVEFSFDR